MKSFVVALLACLAGISVAIAAVIEMPDLRYLRASTGYDNTGIHGDFFDSVPDLSVYSMDNAIQSVCITGVWTLFFETNYEGSYANIYGGVYNCFNLSPFYANQTSSFRYSGSVYGINDVYYNLYENSMFGGLEFKGNTNAETVEPLDQDVSSLTISGQSPWTFFTGILYSGEAVCVYPTSRQSGENGIEIVFGHVGTMAELGLPDNSIRSVLRGCVSERIVRLPPSEASVRPEGDHKLTNSAH